MTKIEIDLNKLSTLQQEITLFENRKNTLEIKIETLNRECGILKDITEKEIAQKVQDCDIACQEKIVKADSLLKVSEIKLKAINIREEESLVIEQMQKSLDEKIKLLSEKEKEINELRKSLADKEKKAELLIEQYTKKLEELELKK